MADPLSVQCPSCLAPANVACRSELGTHADRQDSADLRAVEHGTCALCKQPMVYGVPLVGDQPVAWHPDEDDAAVCPPLPDPRADWDAYALALQQGLAPGRPGIEHFVPNDMAEHGRRLASERDDLIAQGIDPAVLDSPLHPDDLDAQIDRLHGPGAAAALDEAMTNGFPAICPECRAGKCGNCDGSAWDDVTDKAVPCACPNHPERATDG